MGLLSGNRLAEIPGFRQGVKQTMCLPSGQGLIFSCFVCRPFYEHRDILKANTPTETIVSTLIKIAFSCGCLDFCIKPNHLSECFFILDNRLRINNAKK